jgi:hypothetical protein
MAGMAGTPFVTLGNARGLELYSFVSPEGHVPSDGTARIVGM